MTIQTRYITPDDFKEYFGIDLGAQLKGNANPSDKAMAFLKRIEDRMQSFVNAHFFKNISEYWTIFSDYQKEKYQLALLEQAIYVFRNGDISVDSGYEPEQGFVISRNAIKELTLAPNAINYLIECGIWNRQFPQSNWSWPWVM